MLCFILLYKQIHTFKFFAFRHSMIKLFILDWGAVPLKTDLLSPSFIDEEACNPIQTFSHETNFKFPSSK